jgi:glycosyltransferase involved in cell wall biosynthesis
MANLERQDPQPESVAEVSVIAPLYNEEESVRLLYDKICAALNRSFDTYEIILVDDGSSDTTPEILRELAAADHRVKVVLFRRNYGQTPAMSAGIDYASGDVLVTMDGDLQNDPDDIYELVSEVRAGSDIVVGWRANRKDKWLTRKLPSKIANWLIGKVTGVPIRDNGCSLKAYRSNVIKNIPLYAEMHRFIPAMTSIAGARIKELKVRHHARQFGVSKYGLGRIFRVLIDLITVKTIISVSAKPLVWFSMIALPALLLMFASGGYSLMQFLAEDPSATVIAVGMTLQFGALGTFLIVCGMLCELIFHTAGRRSNRYSIIAAKYDND